MEAREFVDNPGLTLVPTDDEELTAEEELDNAVAAALEDVHAIDAPPVKPIPFGRSWKFDRQRGRFLRSGGAPVEVRNREALAEWMLNALATAAGHHAIFPDEFGMDDPTGIIGEHDPTMQMADWEREAQTALVVHDRIAAVEAIELEWDPTVGVVYLTRMDVLTDDDEAVVVLDVPIMPEV